MSTRGVVRVGSATTVSSFAGVAVLVSLVTSRFPPGLSPDEHIARKNGAMAASEETRPAFRQVVLDTENARELAEFYRELLGLIYEPGDEVPPSGEPDPAGEDWLVLLGPDERRLLAFQQVPSLPRATWPEGPRPQMLHLDFSVSTLDELRLHNIRALSLGATLLEDRIDDPDEALVVLADPAGHPFCLFVA
jgi:hypothetical protein